MQVLSYVSLKYLYYRIPFGWHNWGLLFPLGAFSTAVVTYHNTDEQRSILNATHFDYTFVTDFIQLVSYAVLHVPGVHFTAYLAWFACGITSFVAAWLFIRTVVSIGKMVRRLLPCVLCLVSCVWSLGVLYVVSVVLCPGGSLLSVDGDVPNVYRAVHSMAL